MKRVTFLSLVRDRSAMAMYAGSAPDAVRLLALDELRRELADLAFELERRGNPEAADLATGVAARLAEIGEPGAPSG